MELEQLRQASIESLSEIAIHTMETSDIVYRAEVMKRMSAQMQSEHAIIYDDPVHAVTPEQQKLFHGLPGYERVLQYSLWVASGFEEGATAILSAPPLGTEIRDLHNDKVALEAVLGRELQLRVMYEDPDGILIDCMQLDEDVLAQHVKKYAKWSGYIDNVKGISPDHHVDVIKRNVGTITRPGNNAVLPFQVNQRHKDIYAEMEFDAVLPDVPIMDKAYNNLVLREAGLGEYVPHMVIVSASGEQVSDSEHLGSLLANEQVYSLSDVAKFEEYSRQLIGGIDTLAGMGKRAYVKLESGGVSGLGNLDPSEEIVLPIYDTSLEYEQRKAHLKNLLLQRRMETIPSLSVVEEFLEAAVFQGVKLDYGVCGVMVDGTLLPTSICPFDTTNGVYDCLWISSDASDLQEDCNQWQELFRISAQAAKAIGERTGYNNGTFSVDVMKTVDGRVVIHDYNFRRGGRSTPEVLTSIYPNRPILESQVEISATELGLDPRGNSNEDLVTTYQKVANTLSSLGIRVFSGALAYFGIPPHPQDEEFIKLRVLADLRSEELRDLDRSQQSKVLRDKIKKLAKAI